MARGSSCTRRGAGRHHDRHFVEHQRGVLDEHRIGMVAVDVQRDHATAALSQCVAVLLVLAHRGRMVHRRIIGERPHAEVKQRRGTFVTAMRFDDAMRE